ncbi:M67 family metallopeptidase [Paenibacillus sp. MMS20-IR301]|uniref:M67 family metallopeptidase n=1 Tax=Paenibacillus sp. MMS20-IR301 TaxID=2895946 RepID=UPI0028EE1D97|nr:M67 family metallopeptidase [Paenibacillus sp. MMS20-IR301]WNS46151.1 M67 family metallopeptidase [Paenibacillus sp. MMS20-IR301]
MTAFQGTPQSVRLGSSVQQMLGKHMLSCYPQEACGILLGTAAAGGMCISSYVPIRNVAPDPLHFFVPEPEAWIRVLYHEPSLVGLFHSHPNSAPWPSPADLNGLAALGPEFKLYLIGSPGAGSGLPVFNGFFIQRTTGNGSATAYSLQQVPLSPA